MKLELKCMRCYMNTISLKHYFMVFEDCCSVSDRPATYFLKLNLKILLNKSRFIFVWFCL